MERVGVSKPTMIAWRKRYAGEGIEGLGGRPKSERPATIDEVRLELFNLVLLASALADQGKVEEACETGLAALRIASDVRSARTVTYLTDLSHRLAPFSAEPAVRMLNEQIGLLVQRDWGA